jgi:hypothetical protein
MKQAIVFVLLLAAAGCAKHETTTTATTGSSVADGSSALSAATLTPEQLGELGAQVAKNPDNATQLLAAKGLDQTSFEAQIRKVSEDPAASRRYAAAFKAVK